MIGRGGALSRTGDREADTLTDQPPPIGPFGCIKTPREGAGRKTKHLLLWGGNSPLCMRMCVTPPGADQCAALLPALLLQYHGQRSRDRPGTGHRVPRGGLGHPPSLPATQGRSILRAGCRSRPGPPRTGVRPRATGNPSG